MFAKERQDLIYEMLQKSGAVMTSELVKIFSVSIETIRRDLLALEHGGYLTRVHGGGIAKNNMKPFLELNKRNEEHFNEKSELSAKAADFICEGDIIGVDSGSTAISFAKTLKDRFSKLTVVTHSYDVFEILRNCRDFSVILCGGCYLNSENAFYGELTINALSSLHVQKAFIFPSAVSLKHGIFDYLKELYQIQKKLVSVSDFIYILADSSKFEKTGLFKMSDTKPDYTYVTDSCLPNGISKLYKEHNIKIYSGGK